MVSLIKALDQKSNMTIGENGDEIDEVICQFYFQLIRTKDTTSLQKQLKHILSKIHDKKEYSEQLDIMYKIILNTRDIVAGKGEYALTYMQIPVWFDYYPNMAEAAVKRLVIPHEENAQPIGSWKDIKFLSEYVYTVTQNHKHPLILCAIDLMNKQLKEDYIKFLHKKGGVSLAAKWCPREKGKYSWFYKDLVYHANREYFHARTTKEGKYCEYRRACKQMRNMLSTLNKHIDTVQIKMCSDRWSDIKFNNVTSNSMRKFNDAFLNINKDKSVRSMKEDRVKCQENLRDHINNVKVHGKRTSLYELVKDANEMNIISDEAITFLKEILDNPRY